MEKYKNLKYMLLCVGLLAALTGCGTDAEESSVAETLAGTSSAFEAEAETESETDTEQESTSAKKTDKKSGQGSESESETEDTSVASETGSSETSTDSSAQTTVSATEQVQNTDTASIAPDDQNQDQETPQEEQPQQDPVTPDAPQQITDASPDVTPDPVPDVTEPDVTDPPAADPNALTVTYQGNVITVGEDVTAFKNAVKPSFEESAPSCMRDGEDIVYHYDDLTVYVWGNAGSLLVTGVDIMSPGIAPVQGYDIQSAADFTGEKIIDCGNGYNIILTEAGGQVITISYNKDF